MGETSEPREKRGCLGRLAGLVVFVGLLGLGAAVYFVVQPQDLSDLEGRGAGAAGKASRDLPQVMQNALDGGYALTLTEEEINLFLRDTLKAEQGGRLAGHVKIRGVAVRLEDGRAEVIIDREIAGRPLTLSMYLRVEQIELPDGRVMTRIFRDGGQYHESLPRPAVGGRFGQLPVPEGFLHLVLPSFTELAAVYRLTDEERKAGGRMKALDYIDEMSRIGIEDGKLVLEPVSEAGVMPLPGGGR